MRRPLSARLPIGPLVGLFALLTLGPLLLLAYLSVTLSEGAVREEATAAVRATAIGRASAVATEMGALSGLVQSYARRPRLIEAFSNRESELEARELRRHVRELRQARPGIAVAFATDDNGVLLDIVPVTPAIVGRDFSFRDWYRGVTTAGGPYVSEAYVTAARGNALVVAAAVPIRPSGAGARPTGILVAAYGLHGIQRFVDRLSTSTGIHVTVTDQRGVILAMPGYTPSRLVSRLSDPAVAAALEGRSGVLDRGSGEREEVAAFAPVPELGWTVTASTPARVAFARIDRLRTTVLAIVVALALVLGGALALLASTLRRRAAAERRVEEGRLRLAERNAQLEAQRGELERAFTGLDSEKARIETFYEFGILLAERAGARESEQRVLGGIADIAEADLGVLYTLPAAGGENGLAVAAVRGLDPGLLPSAPGEGPAGRALAERKTVTAAYPQSALVVRSLGGEVAVRHELHVPLVQGEELVGLLSLGRLHERPFERAEIDAVEHLAGQAASALANALADDRLRRLSTVNRAVLDATREGVTMIDLEGNVLLRNVALEHLLAELPGPTAAGPLLEQIDSFAAQTADPDGFRAALTASVGDTERDDTFSFELRELRRSFELYTTPVRDAEGIAIGRMFMLRDTTSERQAEQLKSDLVMTVSHELRTPLTGILGFAELLLLRPNLSLETRERYARSIHSQGQRLTQLITDFLDLQKIESGNFALRRESFELAPVLRAQVELFSAQSAAHSLELSLPDDPVVLLGERDRIAQVVANLLSNALKYSPAGGAVRVEARMLDGAVQVRVSDQGLGIPAAQQGRLFEKFFRVDSASTHDIGGTGLGLALSREIVRSHGGHMGFESEEGAGSTFWFELTTAVQAGAGGAHVLVIEDDPVAAALLAEHLAAEGLSVEVAATGADALARAEAHPPVLVCLDISLAGPMDGWEVLARLKQSPATAGAPVIVCSAGNGREGASTLGAADFLAKPFTRERLLATVRRLLPGPQRSVLVVDDDSSIRRLIAETLADDGVEVREAADGGQALAAVAERQPDAIVLDLSMPVVDGFAVLERLHAEPGTRSIPVVVLTARALSEEERATLTSRAVALLEKSIYSPTELRSLVRETLALRAA